MLNQQRRCYIAGVLYQRGHRRCKHAGGLTDARPPRYCVDRTHPDTAVALLDRLRLSCVGDDRHNLGLTRGNVGLNRYNVDQSQLDFDTTQSNTGCTYRCNTGSYLLMQHWFVRGDVAPVGTNRCNAGGGNRCNAGGGNRCSTGGGNRCNTSFSIRCNTGFSNRCNTGCRDTFLFNY
ncbi:hypothetical protein PCANC_15552 [Puccinia coronata f. sp. avenae]|uniref:Uncharacterized protein n=1 Tax=Puccinia coronata f. sp. avenae TaxID=200324 RepID=A0A2N5SX84_9BASI|nr:hypothetical protein PCANC_15552 [Puccinia coronata f. sp. avenae]